MRMYAELAPLQARQARVEVLAARVATLKQRQAHAVASTIDNERRVFAAANAQNRTHTVRLEDGRVVQLQMDDTGRLHPLHQEPIYAIPEGYRTPQELQRTIELAQNRDWNRNVVGPAAIVGHGAVRNWDSHALQIAQRHTELYRMHHNLAQQAARERRLQERGPGSANQQEQRQTQAYTNEYHRVDTAVRKEVTDYLKLPPDRQAGARPVWATGTGPITVQQIMDEVNERMAQRPINRPGQAQTNPTDAATRALQRLGQQPLR